MYIKNKIARYIGALSIGSVLMTGCAKVQDFGDLNVNPNGASTVITGALLTNSLANLGGITSTLVPGLYCQYYAESTYPGTSLYNIPNFSSAATYRGNLYDLQVIINLNSDPKTAGGASASGDNNNQIQIARILKAYHFSVLTDRWGDMPYSEALQGAGMVTPKYDNQESMYKSFISELTDASAKLDASPGAAKVKGDIAYDPPPYPATPRKNEDVIAGWKRLANSLRMLFALRLSEQYPAIGGYAATEFKNAFTDAGGYISTNAQNFMVTYPGGNIKNPYFALGQTIDNAVSSTFTGILNGLNDTRVSVLSGSSTGVAYGLSSAAPANSARIFTASYRAETSPFYFVTASHVLLAIAEAYERGWITGTAGAAQAETFYNNGVAASFAQWGVTLPSGYLTGGAADFNIGGGVASIGSAVTVPGSSANTPTKLSRIQLQQFIAYYPDGTQGWSNWRRTDVPTLKPTVNANNSSKQIVRRYTYAPDEYSLNGAQLAKQIATMAGGDSQDTHVWWDK